MKLKKIVIIAVCLLFQPFNSNAQEEDKESPNIILMMADDLGWGDVGYNGHEAIQTPHLDEMAANGLQFNRFYSASAVCSPTRGSVLTGRHPERYGITFANTGFMKPRKLLWRKP